jgi:hypothetical protein
VEEPASSITFMDCWQGRWPPGGDSYSISTAHLRYGRVYDILTDLHIVTRIKGTY